MTGEATRNAGGTPAAPTEGQRHQVRVFPGVSNGDGTRNLTLRCCCGHAWNLEQGHTTGELDALAVQHTGGTA